MGEPVAGEHGRRDSTPARTALTCRTDGPCSSSRMVQQFGGSQRIHSLRRRRDGPLPPEEHGRHRRPLLLVCRGGRRPGVLPDASRSPRSTQRARCSTVGSGFASHMLSVRSSNTTADQFMLTDHSGVQHAIQLRDFNVAVRTGQLVSATEAVRPGRSAGCYVLVVNHSTGTVYSGGSGVCCSSTGCRSSDCPVPGGGCCADGARWLHGQGVGILGGLGLLRGWFVASGRVVPQGRLSGARGRVDA